MSIRVRRLEPVAGGLRNADISWLSRVTVPESGVRMPAIRCKRWSCRCRWFRSGRPASVPRARTAGSDHFVPGSVGRGERLAEIVDFEQRHPAKEDCPDAAIRKRRFRIRSTGAPARFPAWSRRTFPALNCFPSSTRTPNCWCCTNRRGWFAIPPGDSYSSLIGRVGCISARRRTPDGAPPRSRNQRRDGVCKTARCPWNCVSSGNWGWSPRSTWRSSTARSPASRGSATRPGTRRGRVEIAVRPGASGRSRRPDTLVAGTGVPPCRG